MSNKLLFLIPLVGLIAWTSMEFHPSVADIRQALGKSLPLLQTGGRKFMDRASHHCVSCHHNILTAVVEEKCATRNVACVDTSRAARIRATLAGLHFACNPSLQSNFIAAKFISAYALLELKADHYTPDYNTDISVDYLLGLQKPDGTYGAEFGRPPMEVGEAHLAALCIYDIQAFASPAKSSQVAFEVRRTRQWLDSYQSDVVQEQVFQLLGLYWCHADVEEKQKVALRLLGSQRPDGSWSQLSSMSGDAYATGEVLYALAESGALDPGDERYQQGVSWLLKKQDATGAWIVETRAYPIQPFFSADFPPYDENQFISAAATNWASLALLEALPGR
jgi:hypothetical protein